MNKKQLLSGIAILSMCLVLFAVFAVRNETYAAKTGTVTASSLNVRTGAGTSYAQLKSGSTKVALKKGTSVTISSEKSGWYYISFKYNNKTLKGYVLKDYIKVSSSTSTSSSTATKFKVPATTRSVLNVRKSASATAAQLTVSGKKVKLSKGQKITILNEKVVKNEKWYYVSFTYSKKTRYGWVHGDHVKLTLSKSVKAKILPSTLKIRKAAGTSASYLKVSGKVVSLKKAKEVTIKGETLKSNTRFYKISFTYSSKTYTGYVKATDVYFKTTVTNTTATATPAPTAKPTTAPTATPKPTTTPVVTVAPTVTPTPTTAPSPTTYPVLTEKQFTTEMKAKGFPDDYIKLLYSVHKAHPAWQFEAMLTGIDWTTAIAKQTTTKGKNTVQKTTPQWISRLTSTFDFIADKPIATDGTTWFTASEQAVKYYMDPRNFLNETYLFQFETLSYDKANHTREVLQQMVKGTPFDATFTYTTDSGEVKTMYYIDAFMDAAEYSGVSPIHLLAKSRQEVTVSKNGQLVFSDSANGLRAGYEGYYNFFNIGASDTATGSAIVNGLKYAMNGGSNATLNAKMFIPWNNPYKAIMGGAKFLAESYISKGQDTSFLQKFNLSSYSTHSHQYMTNVQAPYSEASKTYKAYQSMGNLNIPIVFKIPVYKSGTMPTTVSVYPDSLDSYYKLSFNTYLKDLSIATTDGTVYVDASKTDGAKFDPTNKGKDATKVQTFTFYNTDCIKVTPTVAHSTSTSTAKYSVTATLPDKTKVTNPSGNLYSLQVGTTTFVVTVTAANGDKDTYKFYVKRVN